MIPVHIVGPGASACSGSFNIDRLAEERPEIRVDQRFVWLEKRGREGEGAAAVLPSYLGLGLMFRGKGCLRTCVRLE